MTLPDPSLGTSGLEITTVGFGSWAVGGGGSTFGWGPQDDDALHRGDRARGELGVNWIDTAAVYGRGHSEEVVGRAVRALPAASRPLVFTKCGLEWDDARSGRSRAARGHARRPSGAGCEDSLRRLGLDQRRPLPDPLARRPGQPDRAGVAGDAQAAGRGPDARRRRLQLRRRPARALRGARPRRLAAAAVQRSSAGRRPRSCCRGPRSTAPACSATAR